MAKEAQEFPEVVNDYPPERHAHDALESIGEVLKAESLTLSVSDVIRLEQAQAVLNSILNDEFERTPV